MLDDYGNIILVDKADAGADARYLYVQDAADSLGLKARAYFLDGTTEDITVKSVKDGTLTVSYTSSTAKANVAGRWYSYSVDSSGRYSLTRNGTSGTTSDATEYSGTISKKDSVAFLSEISITDPGTDKTIMLVLDDGDVHVYQGAVNMPTITGTAKVSYFTASGYIKYVFVDGSAIDVEDGEENADLMFVLKKNDTAGSDVKNNTYTTVDVVLNGSEQKGVKVRTEDAGKLTAGVLYTNLKYNDNGWLIDATRVVDGGKYDVAYGKNGRVTYSGTTLKLDGGNCSVDTNGASLNFILGAGTKALAFGNEGTDMGYKADSVSVNARNLVDRINKVNPGTNGYQYNYYVVHTKTGSDTAKAVYVVGYVAGAEVETIETIEQLTQVLETEGSVTLTDESIGNLNASLTIPEGTTLTIDGTASVTVKDLVIEKNANLYMTGGTLTISGSATNNGHAGISGGTRVMDRAVWNELSKQTLEISGGTGKIGTLNVAATGNVVISTDVTVGTLTMTSTGTSGGTVAVKGADLTIETKISGEGAITVEDGGEVTLSDAAAQALADGTSSFTNTDTSENAAAIYGVGTITITGAIFTGSNPEANVSGATYTISVDANTSEITIDVSDDDGLTDAEIAALFDTDAGFNVTVTVADNKITITITDRPVAAWEVEINLDTLAAN